MHILISTEHDFVSVEKLGKGKAMKYNACVNLSNFSATLLKLSSRDG